MSNSSPARRKVALLDVRTREDQFQDSATLDALADGLRARGHEAVQWRSALSSEPGGVAAWHARITEAMRAGGFQDAVLSRVWDAAIVDAVRAGIAGGRVIRVTSGVAAAIDDRFDHVLDPQGVIELLDGSDVPNRTDLTRASPADLRRRADEAARLPLVDGPDNEGRPIISGPIPGCPFLLDARKNPLFSGLDLDPQRVQPKGCTFCLDNTGTWAAPSTESVIDAWLRGLRRHRRARGAGRLEVLLTDERPHAHLPALFRALLDEPELAPIELLIKSRVDWLLEAADTAIPEAIELAEKSGSVLHLYLVGFESFEQTHLDLFNKGVLVADNIRAIEVMRALADRYPRGFEHRRLRAHGIVLFTPWTRPEHLIESAARMREVRFHELRADALHTRLRLYPRTPLHALAARDGLLTERFEEGRPDRAIEQGYDASTPWRFADDRMEAIFRAANALGRGRARLPDPDALELAARSLVRWPALAKAPDVAHLPMREAQRAFGSKLGALGFDPEIDLLGRGERRGCLKEGVPAADAEGLVRAYRAMGFASEIVATHDLSAGDDDHTRGATRAIVAVAQPDAMEDLLREQRRLGARDDAEAIRAVGAILGYPACCTEAFLGQRGRGANTENERLPFRRAPEAALDPRLHRTGSPRLVSHHLCSPSCAASAQIAERALAALAEIDPAAAARAREEAARPALFIDYGLRLSLRGAWEGARFVVTEAATIEDASSLSFDPAEIAAIELAEDAVVFTLRSGQARRVKARRPLLTTPGAKLAPAALAAIGGPVGDERDEPAPAPKRAATKAAHAGPARRLTVTTACTPRCPSCVACPTEPRRASLEDALALVDQPELVLGGGDVTRWQPLAAYLARATRDEPAQKVWIEAPARAFTPPVLEALARRKAHGVIVLIEAAGAALLKAIGAGDGEAVIARAEALGLATAARLAARPKTLPLLAALAGRIAPRRTMLELLRDDWGHPAKPISPAPIAHLLTSTPSVAFSGERMGDRGYLPPCALPEVWKKRPSAWSSVLWPREVPNRSLPICESCSLAPRCQFADREALSEEALAAAGPIEASPAG